MSISRTATTTLHCDSDDCLTALKWSGYLPKDAAEKAARDRGWRKDKLGRNLCPVHPKLKGAGRG